ncbi:YybH family protein [Pontibacter beigongshangensis]|uniref:YybH family protein n=1 Tax=Pontibacter beigongshangensis TaxID=2574733 RepID=UPI0016507826|nr:nuclear transport factor 2 family protein [Pontibacter beigongshangensis]
MTTNKNPLTEVQEALEGQINAWNKGDLEKAMTYYWNSEEMLWISKTGIEKGYQEVLNGFLNDFEDRSQMGVYSYQPLHMEELTPEVVYFVFSWKIEQAGKKLMGCISSQLWKKLNGTWVITAEHAS